MTRHCGGSLFFTGRWFAVKIVSWNVNGIRACAKKGFLSWLEEASPDVLLLQETKAWPAYIIYGTQQRRWFWRYQQPRV